VSTVQRCRLTIGTKSGTVADLIGIDVPDASDCGLIEQQRFQSATATCTYLRQRCLGDAVNEWVTSKASQFGNHNGLIDGCVHHHFAKRSRIDKPKFIPVVKERRHMAVRRARER
jgi:hypothetical protein